MKRYGDVKLHVICYDGEPYYGGSSEKFVKAYFDRGLAERTAKAHCTREVSNYYEYGDGRKEFEHLQYPEKLHAVRETIKKRAAYEFETRWTIEEVTV